MQSMTSREFNQDVSKAKRAADKGPVFITDRGTPAHVLLNIDEYHKLIASPQSVAELLSMPETAEIEFEPRRIKNIVSRSVDLS